VRPLSARADKLRGPGVEALRLIGYKSVREVLAELARRRRRASRIAGEHEVASSTFHRHAPELLRVGAIARRVEPGPPRQVSYSLGPTGLELCELTAGWLGLLRELPVNGGELDWQAPGRFAEAWASGVLAAVFDGPLSIPEIEVLVRPARPLLTAIQVERLVQRMTQHGFFESRGGRYAITELGRLTIGELAASARFERLHMPDVAVPITAAGAANALRGSLPLIELPDHDGVCEFVVKADDGDPSGPLAMAWIEISAGHVVATGVGKAPRPAATWAQGSVDDWLKAVLGQRPRVLRTAGRRELGKDVLEQLHSRLQRRNR
jgi:DNA-binding HxlR family transcriptional regulator